MDQFIKFLVVSGKVEVEKIAATKNVQDDYDLSSRNFFPLLQPTDVVELQLPEPLQCFFPWMEYLLRAGWTPDGQ